MFTIYPNLLEEQQDNRMIRVSLFVMSPNGEHGQIAHHFVIREQEQGNEATQTSNEAENVHWS